MCLWVTDATETGTRDRVYDFRFRRKRESRDYMDASLPKAIIDGLISVQDHIISCCAEISLSRRGRWDVSDLVTCRKLKSREYDRNQGKAGRDVGVDELGRRMWVVFF